MDSLRERIYSQPMFNNLNVTVFELLAATFFFELSEVPSFGSGRLYCQGTIRCRLTGKTILSALEQVCKSPLHFYADTEHLDQVNMKNSICYQCQRYSKKIHFYVRHPTDIITLYLQSKWNRRKISGFPQSVEWIVQQQQLGSVFGKANHGTPGRSLCVACSPRTKKRPRPSNNFNLASKRLCIGLYYEQP